MKFLFLANNDSDGIGQTLINLSTNLKKLNQEVKIAVLHSKTNNKNVKIIKRIFFFRIISFLFNFTKIKKINSFKKNFLKLFWFDITTINFKSIKNDIIESDVIIIFTFNKFISNKTFEKIMKSKKLIFLRPLDLELATGGCHFNDSCEEFKKSCNKCPQLNFLNFLNITHKSLKEKKRIIETYKPKVLVQNTFVEKIFLQSSIFRNSKTKIVRLDTRLERKKNYSKNEARNILKLDQKENLILFGAFDLSSHLIFKKKNKAISTIGKKNNFNLDSKIISWTHLGIVNSDKELNLLYRAADLLVCPSLRCFAPHIVSEATENNLPVIAFDVGVAQDDVIDGKNGFLVPCYNTSIFADRIFQSLYNEDTRGKINNLNRNIHLDRTDDEASTIVKYAEKSLKENNHLNYLD